MKILYILLISNVVVFKSVRWCLLPVISVRSSAAVASAGGPKKKKKGEEE